MDSDENHASHHRGGPDSGVSGRGRYDMSYLMIGAYSAGQWRGLYSGQIPWTSAAIRDQLTVWSRLHSSGRTNSDVVTNTDNLAQFESGKAAMMVDGTWDTQKFTTALGKNVAAFVPPFSASPIRGIVDFAGDGLSQMSYSRHPAQDAEVSTGQKFLPSVLGGRVAVSSALRALATTLDQLPASQRGRTLP